MDEGKKEIVNEHENNQEKWYCIAIQLIFPFMIAGLGLVTAGLVLERVKELKVFKEITEIYILIPALLGLKGNLEMTLASRLSTHANIGTMDNRSELKILIIGNIILIQLQAIVIGFLAAIISVFISRIAQGQFNFHHALVLCSSSVSTASIASSVLCLIMITIIVLSHKTCINPDNIATPIAESLGDLITLVILSIIGSFIFKTINDYLWLPIVIIGCYILLIPVWAMICARNKYAKDALIEGWFPIIAAMLISSTGGLILDFAVQTFHGIAVFQPCMDGVGGSLGAVQASRLSTAFHKKGKPEELKNEEEKNNAESCPNPIKVFCSKSNASCTIRVLLFITIPGHLTFMFLIWQLAVDHIQFSALFILLYLIAALIQVAIILYIAQWLVPFAWKQGHDPDNTCIPYLTSIGDLLGIALLTCVFILLP
ncbi:unnamed protein product [Rotaria magnacalcarata]|uniref:SLC41A/MgtE integral membrane domain-containing protein n=2 Tax=Rotaria magnacalcarata TaxID=392030 RepID=A0A819RJ90_9BILA|nr:unnamed protein product [Rotaria magnacalcarata]CAF1590065.1 unnamed protein product [Rotaria magnacalcarata]CAF2060994.1 unnamed protein product [Rotaria magnacalcarata]CAF2138310.1 unnamed protein product [Rotaria magnacalcarata]CAF2214737.1 unnamed protein product [Rotaria magnacalcarata]